MNETLAIVGSGAIACGLAATAAHHGDVVLLARSDASANRARQTIEKICSRLESRPDPGRVEITTDPVAIGDASFVVEAVVEDHAVKADVLARCNELLDAEALLATTTSSLSVGELAEASGRPGRFVGLHVFNPVAKMKLVELVLPPGATPDTRLRAAKLCEAMEKVAIEVPDTPGFVVNRLLFPYLFNAVRLLEETEMEPTDIDLCMQLGTGHPMGPLALLDLIGLDVARAIGESIGEEIPPRVHVLIAEGALGRKAGRGLLEP